MSADRWSRCPECIQQERKRSEAAKAKAREAYGQVTPDEYAMMLEAARYNVVEKDTLREDWEVGQKWDAPGIFLVSYRASCPVCGFTYKHRYEAPMVEMDKKD